MACRILRNETTNQIIEVFAENGEPSILYNNILKDLGDKELAYTKYLEVLNDFNNFEEFVASDNDTVEVPSNQTTQQVAAPVSTDKNGEPIYTPREVTITEDTTTREELSSLIKVLRETNTLDNNDFNCK